MKRTLFISAATLLLVAFLVTTLVYKAEKVDESGQPAQQNSEYLVRMHSPVLGNAGAKVEIVEFFDPACETCRVFYPLVKQIMAEHPDQIRLVLRYAPFHQGADQVVAVLEAARRQGKFWPALEALLAAQEQWTSNHTAQVNLVWQHLGGLGLNLEQMRVDMNSAGIAQIIAQDLDDARALKVTKTPGFFVNGRPLETFGYEPLKAMVDNAMASPRR
jgi:protein-disulfide isomerase